MPSRHELMQRSMEPFDSQPTGEVASPNEDYLYESRLQPIRNFAVSILMIFIDFFICQSALHPAYVISHDLVNLPIFCYDYKLCLSTIITFEK